MKTTMNRYAYYTIKDNTQETLKEAFQTCLNKANSSLVNYKNISNAGNILLYNIKSALRGRVDYHVYSKVKLHSIDWTLEEDTIKRVQLRKELFEDRNYDTIQFLNTILERLEYKKMIDVSKIDLIINDIKNYPVHNLKLVY